MGQPSKDKVCYVKYFGLFEPATYRWDRDVVAADPPAAADAADDDDGDWAHRMRLSRRPALAVVRLAGVADMHWPYTKAAVNRHRNDPAAPWADHPAAAADRNGPAAAVHHNDEAAVADHHDTQPPAGNDGRVPHALHGRPHTDADDAYAAPRCRRAPIDGHGKRQRPRQLQPQRLHKMAAAVHDDPAVYAPYAGPDPGHDTCPR